MGLIHFCDGYNVKLPNLGNIEKTFFEFRLDESSKAQQVKRTTLVEAFMSLFFCAGQISIFVPRSKQVDMLKGITWGQFSILIMIVAGAYYLYVLLAYYRAEAIELLTKSRSKKRDSLKKPDSKIGSLADPDAAPATSQAELFKIDRIGDQDNEQFQQMQRAIAVVRQVIEQGIENKLDRENLLDHIRDVLVDYRALRKTEYAGTVNNYLIRVCSAELSLELGEKELSGLWK